MIKNNSNWKALTSPFEDILSVEELVDYKIINKKENQIHKPVCSSVPDKRKKRKKKIKKLDEISSSKKTRFNLDESDTFSKKSKSSMIRNKCKDTNSKINHSETSYDIEKDMRSWSSHNLPFEIINALHSKQYFQPTEIQAATLFDAIVKKKDILGAAETGSGKTLAFSIPIVADYMQAEKNNNIDCKLWAVIVTPTRELAIQIKNHISDLCKYTNIKILEIVGGLSSEKQNRKLNEQPQIIIGTPGRLWELIRSGNGYLSQINRIRYFVIDEADRMLETNHFAELKCLLERLNYEENSKSVKQRQVFVFSATLTLTHDPPSYIFKKNKRGKIKSKEQLKITSEKKLQSFIDILGLKNPSIIDCTRKNVLAAGITEYCIRCSFEEKDYYLYYILKTNNCKKIIFANSVNSIKRLQRLLHILCYNPKVLFADMAQNQRLKNLEGFQNDPNGLLLATDVAARGLDIANINLIIHYQVPKTSEIYVHRSGRSVRGSNQQGVSVLLCCPSENYHCNKVKCTLGKDERFMEYEILHPEIYLSSKRIINKANEIERLDSKIRSIQSNASWMKKRAKEMDILIDDDEMPHELNENMRKSYHKFMKQLQSELKQLMSQPVLPLLESLRYPKFNTVNSFIKLYENKN